MSIEPHCSRGRAALLVATLLATMSVGCDLSTKSAPPASPTQPPPSNVSPAPGGSGGSLAPSGPGTASADPETAGVWQQAEPMLIGRVGFDSVVLGDGTVLVVGDDMDCYPGPAEPGSERAEVYEPDNDRWVGAQSLNKPRKTPATVRLNDGSAMVIGGINDEDVPFSSTKIFDATARTWTDGPLLNIARGQPLAATLEDGRVLVTSVVGSDETSSRMTSELYDPATHKWSAAAPLDGPYLDELLPLTDGRVLGIGSGFEISLLLEVYDPADNAWTPIETPPAPHSRPQFVALPRGRILAAGGFAETDTGGGPTDMVETYDPGTNRWTAVGSLKTARADAATTTLPDGRVIFAGGQAGDDFSGRALGVVEAFHLDTGSWTSMADLFQPRYGADALVLADDSVLLLGGYADFNVNGDTPWCPTPITSVERLSPAP